MSKRAYSGYNRRKKKPWYRLARQRRHEDYIELKGRIIKEGASPLFVSDHLLDQPGPPSQWADILFLGLDGVTVWNATVETCALSFWDKAKEASITLARQVREAAGVGDDDKHYGNFIHGGKKLRQEPQRFDCYGGLTWYEFIRQEEARFCAEGNFEVCEEFVLFKNFRYGVGVTLIVNEPAVTTASIERTIGRFRTAGEKAWCSAPLPRHELPSLPILAASLAEMKLKPENSDNDN